VKQTREGTAKEYPLVFLRVYSFSPEEPVAEGYLVEREFDPKLEVLRVDEYYTIQ